MERDQLYRDYITIVFGLVATKGLEKIAERALDGKLDWSQAPFFIGAFLVGIHYWYVCVSYAGISSPTYKALAKHPSGTFWKNISRIVFFGVPVLFVSVYAGSVVMFFYSIPDHYSLLFWAFWILLATSAVNDIWDLAATSLARSRGAQEEDVKEAQRISWRWLACDGIYALVFYLVVKDRVITLSNTDRTSAGMVFLGLIALGVVLDAIVTPAKEETSASVGKGLVSVASSPSGARVSVDNEFVGNTPAALKLTEGKHTVTLTAAGHKDSAEQLTVKADSYVPLMVTLEAQLVETHKA